LTQSATDHCDENPDSYVFRGGIVVPDEPGIYAISAYTVNLLYDYYEHPSLYECGNNRRSVVNVNYSNSFSTIENYENIYLNNASTEALEFATFEGYQTAGIVSFFVR